MVNLPLNIATVRSIQTPVYAIKEAAEKLALGDLNITLSPEGNDEITQIETAFVRMISALQAKSEIAKTIANRDLTQNIVKSSDKDVLGESLCDMQQNLKELIISISTATIQIDSGSAELSDMGQELSHASTTQAASVEEISSSIQEVSSSTETNANDSEEVEALAIEQVEAAASAEELSSQAAELRHLISLFKTGASAPEYSPRETKTDDYDEADYS